MPFVLKLKQDLFKYLWNLTPIRIPEVYSGTGCITDLGCLLNKRGIKKVLIVTDNVLSSIGLLDGTFDSLAKAEVEYALFDEVTPDPDVKTCVSCKNVYVKEGCQAIIAFGGGSSMDCAKFVALLTCDPDGDPHKYLGAFQLGPTANLPLVIAIPTTAGTGSETTIVAVVSDKEQQKKFAALDLRLVPDYAFLDASLLEKLPKAITAATGIDALTHAVESYLSRYRSSFTSDLSLRAVKNIFDFLPRAYADGSDMQAREKTLLASFDAGVAFTRASVGYVHAIAHQLGAVYHVPHGEANAIILPHVLDFYNDRKTATTMQALAKMCLIVENRGHESVKSEERNELADRFVAHVRELCRRVDIPSFVKGFGEGDVLAICQRALDEAHGNSFKFMEEPMKALADLGMPVPKFMNQDDCRSIVLKLVDPSAPKSSKL